MPSLPLYDLNKKKIGTVDLSDAIFAAEVKPYLVNQAVRTQIARRYEFRTANSLTRSEVKATRQKMYRQKGTGQARHGNTTAPNFVGGGKSHGPRPRRVRFKTNKKQMRSALISVLSMLQKEDRIFVVDKMELEKHSTKNVAGALKAFGLASAVFVNSDKADGEKVFNRSTRNLQKTKTLRPAGVNVFDLLKYKHLLLSKSAVEELSKRLQDV
ncbi:MAG: 50S ribosomal protein L4 [Bdellovibrionales bacterium]|nr:50S ribosomal protein L4 [Bdellovibrionales bacterium]